MYGRHVWLLRNGGQTLCGEGICLKDRALRPGEQRGGPRFAGNLGLTYRRHDGKTSPEELITAAHASCYAMALSNVLAQMGNEPEELNISAVCTFDVGQVKVTKMVLDVRGRVPGLDAEGFRAPQSRARRAVPSPTPSAATWTSS